MPAFAYLFERFPAFTQTFCYREVLEMEHQLAERVPVFSIHPPDGGPEAFPAGLLKKVTFLPDSAEIRKEVKAQLKAGELPPPIAEVIRRKDRRDILRAMEAVWLGSRLKKAGVEHVHVHFAGMAARTAYWLKKFYNIRYSITCHANDIFCENRFAITLAELFKEASFVVTVADFTKEWLLERYSAVEGKVHRVYNGIAPLNHRETFGESVTRGEPPHLLSVGRCIPKKGFGDLIEACGILRDQGVEFRCTIVGDGPLLPDLRAKIAALKLESMVEMPGALPQARIQEFLSQSQLFSLACAVEPNGGMDCLPTVIAEAMMWGLPVVSTRLAAVPEMVLHQKTGLLVEPHNPRQLAAAIGTILKDPEGASAYGTAGQAYAMREFSVEKTVAQLREILEPQGKNFFAISGKKMAEWRESLLRGKFLGKLIEGGSATSVSL